MVTATKKNTFEADKVTFTNSTDTFTMEGNVKIKGSLDKKDQPLYVIDSKIASSNEMNNLEPNSINTINVIKGEAAISKYGNQAKNGVIEVFTKEGKSDPVTSKDNKVFTKRI